VPFTPEQISYAGKSAIDYILRGKPEDLYNTDRPLLKKLRATQKPIPGAKQFINEKLRITNDSNFQWFGPDGVVTYNRKRTLEEANFEWRSAHDGFGLSEEELLQNYITVTDDPSNHPTTSEKHQFINLMNENTETLMLGFKEKFDYDLHLDGTQDVEAVIGLDAIVSTDPTTGVLGGIDRAVAGNEYWRNHAAMDIAVTAGVLTQTMEQLWRLCTRVGGNSPDFILCGSKFLDAYRVDAKSEIDRRIGAPIGGTTMDPGVGGGTSSGLFFKGVPIIWDPVMDDLQANLSPTYDWDKRCYFLNTRFLKLRPAKGQDMVTRRPPRAYDRYTHYFGLTWRGGMTTNRPGSMAVMSVV
jgi:hypothetical protein